MTAAIPRGRALRGSAVAALILTLIAIGQPAIAVTPTALTPSGAATLPSGRTTYRTFADYDADLTRLAVDHPTKARRFALARSSLEGRPVHALEISRNVTASGHKPALVVTGAHHAREWPSSEVTIEFAFELLRNDGIDPRVTALLDRIRIIAVPIVNPDGFKISRDLTFEMKRRNCRVRDGQMPAPGECARSANFAYGVDLNRNYGAGWSGGGSRTSDTYPGPGPFSEPESQNIRDLVSSRQVTVLLSNHTYGAVVLRPTNPEDGVYRVLADRLAADNGYGSSALNVGGMTERWSYYATGGFGFTVEIGTGAFHPAFQTGVVDQYLGVGTRRGLRSMFLSAGESAADRAKHAVLTGRAAPETTLRIVKDFNLTTAGGQAVPTHLESSLTVGSSGTFAWDVNPSTRPSGGTVLDERWTLTCALPGRPVAQTVQVLVRRGQQAPVDLPACQGGGGDDFALALDPDAGRVEPGTSTASTITTRVTAGRAQRVTFGVHGLPPGAVASVSPPEVTAGESARMDVTTSVSTPPGSYPLTVTGRGASGLTRTATFTLAVGGPQVVYSDVFESPSGWTVNPLGTDTATVGRWERADPQPTSYAGTVLQLGTTTSGQHDLVTGALSGVDSGSNDVDGGVTSVQSPDIVLPTGAALTLSLRYYLAHLDNSSNADHLTVRLVVDTGVVTLHQVSGAAVNRGGTWETATVDLSAYAGRTVRLRVEAADSGTASLLEAGVDDVQIVRG